jgi:hypothetical protein
VKQKAKQINMPVSLLIGIMAKESSANCLESQPGDGSKGSYGIFQINVNSQTAPACTTSQINSIQKSRSLASLQNGPKCLHNPVIALDEAIKNIKMNLSLVRQEFPNANHWDTWRLVTSSYNGGFEWVKRAKYDLIDFTSKNQYELQYNKIGLNHNKFTDLMPFYLKQKTAMMGELSKFYSDERTSRDLKYAKLNLNYVLKVLGTSGTPHIEKAWTEYL